MIFVSVGTQDIPFDRLLKSVENQIELGNIKEKVIVQAGVTNFKSDKTEIVSFIPMDEFKKIIKEFQPDIVIGTGGYICGATISSAHSLGIPTLLHESNAFPGKAVKMLAKKTDTILVSFEDVLPRHQSYKKSTQMKLRKSQLLNNVCLPDLVP